MSDHRISATIEDGRLYWMVGGRKLAAIMGASNPDPGDGGDGGDGGDPGDGDGDGDGGQQPPRTKAKAKAKAGGDDGVPDPVGAWFDALPAEGKAYFRELKRTAAGSSKKARDAQAQLDAVQQSTMSTEQRLQMALEREQTARQRAEQKLRTQSVQGAFSREGGAQGAIYPNDLWRQVDPDDIQWDPETGEVLNAAELVENLRRSFPKLFEDRRPAAGVDAGRRPAPQRQRPDSNEMMNQLIRQRRG